MKSLLVSVWLLAACAGVAAAQDSAPAVVKLEGQIVCSECWFEDDRRKKPYGGTEDLECAKDCAGRGIPAALAVKNKDGEDFSLYLLEDGRFDKKAKDWLAFIGKQVEVSGAARAKKNKLFFKVDELNVLVAASEPVVGAQQEANIVGTSSAELVMKDLFGVEQRLGALRGRVVVLNFWATYCVPCRKEMPDLAAIQNEYAALGLQVVGASADPAEDQLKVMQFIKETKLNFPVWLGATVDDMRKFGLGPALPGTVIIGRDGRIVWQTKGIVNQAEIKKQIDVLLAQSAKRAKEELASVKARPSEVSSVPS